MLETTNYNLKKIELTDSPPDITVINPNWDKIDVEMKSLRELNNDCVPKANIIQTDVVNDSTKVPSSAVTYAHGLEIDAINGKMIHNNIPDGTSMTLNLNISAYIVIGRGEVGFGTYFVDFDNGVNAIHTMAGITVTSVGGVITITNNSGSVVSVMANI